MERIYSGHLKTSLEMHGFQIFLMQLPKEKGDFYLELLDAPSVSAAWTGSTLSARVEGGHGDDDTLLKTAARKVSGDCDWFEVTLNTICICHVYQGSSWASYYISKCLCME